MSKEIRKRRVWLEPVRRHSADSYLSSQDYELSIADCSRRIDLYFSEGSEGEAKYRTFLDFIVKFGEDRGWEYRGWE